MSNSNTLYEQIGGRPYLQKIARNFYEKVYSHPWLAQFFKNTQRETIERQQVDFMTGALGGPRVYQGRMPNDAHTHIRITTELFALREKLLIETLNEENAPPELIDRWLKIEHAFKSQLIKNSAADCTPRWRTDEILDFANPDGSPVYRRSGT